METRTYNTIVTSKELEILNNVVKRCPYECIELESGKYGFMDNENGDIRNYFCDTLGYECSNYESFDFEYFNEPQTFNENKPNFYTSNGWQGSKYDIKKGAKEVAKELRSYIKANPDLNACKWSIRSTRGMCADSLYISMMAAPFDPFTQEYKEKHEYRYNRGYSEHGTIKDYTSPEAYKLMMKVKAFVMQYIHDDSDVMTDYFDRNIYDHYEIGQYDKPFQLIEKKESAKQTEPSREPNEAKTSEPIVMSEGLEIVDYSEKAIAVFGNTKAIKEQLKGLGGRFNPSLNYNGEKRAGWIFSKKQAEAVRELANTIQQGQPSIDDDTETAHDKEEKRDPKKALINSKLKEFKGLRYYELKNGKKIIAKIYFPNEFHPLTFNIEYPFGVGAEYKDLESLVKELNKYLDGCYFGDYELIGDLTRVVTPVDNVNISTIAKEIKSSFCGETEISQGKGSPTKEVEGIKVEAYFVEDPDKPFIPETILDQQKKEADMLLKSIDGSWYTIWLNRGIEIKSKRIKHYDNGCISVPESIYYKLKDKYNIMCDF